MNFSHIWVGYFVVKLYGVFLAFIFAAAVWQYYKTIQKQKMDVPFFVHHFWRWVIGGVVLGRACTLALHPDLFDRFGWIAPLVFWEGDLHFIGFIIGALGMLTWDLFRAGYKALPWIDRIMHPFLVGMILFDLVVFLTGVYYGSETNLPWGIRYETFGVDNINPVHPVSLYALVAHLGMIYWLKKHEVRLLRTPGKITLVVFTGFFLLDFFLQFFRGDRTIMVFDFLRAQQIADILFIAFVWGGVWALRKYQSGNHSLT